MDHMNALVLDADKKTASVQRISRPTPGPGEVLIRVQAIALNPVDSLYVFNPLGASGRVVGSDFAGTVVESRVESLNTGARVAGFLQGACSSNDRPGAFAEYLVCPADLVWRVPSSTRIEESATISLCALTAAQGLFYRLGLSAPFHWPGTGTRIEPGTAAGSEASSYSFFIYGASTSVGMYAAQLVRRSAEAAGKHVKLIGAASKARFPIMQASPYKYDALVDYRDEDWPAQVKTLAGSSGVDFVYDCISEGPTVKLASSILCPGGRIAVVRSKEGGAFDPQGISVDPIYGAVWEGLGMEVKYQNMVLPASDEARRFATIFYSWLSEDAKLVANPVRLMPGHLERIVPDGFALLGSGSMHDRQHDRSEPWMKSISAEKLVYRIDS